MIALWIVSIKSHGIPLHLRWHCGSMIGEPVSKTFSVGFNSWLLLFIFKLLYCLYTVIIMSYTQWVASLLPDDRHWTAKKQEGSTRERPKRKTEKRGMKKCQKRRLEKATTEKIGLAKKVEKRGTKEKAHQLRRQQGTKQREERTKDELGMKKATKREERVGWRIEKRGTEREDNIESREKRRQVKRENISQKKRLEKATKREEKEKKSTKQLTNQR